MEIVSPTPEKSASPIGAAPRLAQLEGAQLGLLSNGKPNATPLLLAISRRLKEGFAIREPRLYDKVVEARGSGDPAPDAMLDSLAVGVLGVINASGD